MGSAPPPASGDDALGIPAGWWSRIGHDLRGPVGPMRMVVQMLRSGRGNAGERQEALALLDRQIDRLLAEIDDVADLVRLRNGVAIVRSQRADLNLVLDPVAGRSSLLRCLAERDQALVCVPSERELQADYDASRLCMLLDFVLRKAAAHSVPGARLELALRETDGGAEFSISGFGATLFGDPELAWLRGDAVVDPDELGARPILLREVVRQSAATLSADPGRISLSLLLASPHGA